MLSCSKCGGAVCLDMTGGIQLLSPTAKITKGGIEFGVAQIAFTGKKQGSLSFVCRDCSVKSTDKDEIENNMKCRCSVCSDVKRPGKIFVHHVGLLICIDCKSTLESPKKLGEPAVYEYIRGLDISELEITVLTLLVKSTK